MATVYSGEVAVGSYNRIRIKCDYSGTSATLTIQFRRTSSYSTTWSSSSATLTFNGQSKSAAYSYSGTVGTSWVDLRGAISGYTISTSGGTYNWSFVDNAVLGCSGTITVPSQGNQYPDGVQFIPSEITPESVTGTISVAAWNGGSSSTRQKAINVCTSNNANNRRYALATGSQLSDTVTVDNNSTLIGTCNLIGNTRYYFMPWATNGSHSTPNVYTQFVTPPYAPIITLDSVSGVKASFSYALPADGGFYWRHLQYSIDGGNTWKQAMYTETGAAISGTFDITELPARSNVTVMTKVKTGGAETVGPSFNITVGDPEADKIFGSVNGRTKRADLLYGSVNGQSAFIVKMYGSDNGVTKRIF